MKRVIAIFSWLGFALGLPVILVVAGFSLSESVDGGWLAISTQNYNQTFLNLAALIVWSAWLYALYTFLSGLWQIRSGKPTATQTSYLGRLIAISVAAFWSLLIANRATAASEPAPTALHGVEETKHTGTTTVLPLALPASAVAVAGLLQLVQSRRHGVERQAAPHARIEPLSMSAKTALNELQLAAMGNRVDGVRDAMKQIMQSESRSALTSWRPSSTPRAIFDSARDSAPVLPYFCVPIGISEGEVIMLSLGAGQTFFIEGEHEFTQPVLAHLVNTIALESLGSATTIFAIGFDSSSLAVIPNLVAVKDFQQLSELERAGHLDEQVALYSSYELFVQCSNSLSVRACGIVAVGQNSAVDFKFQASISQSPKGWQLSTTCQLISMYGLTAQEGVAINRLVSEVSRPASINKAAISCSLPDNWQILMRVLGPVEVATREGVTVRFEKSKSIELLAWLTTHRSRPTRSAARTALWDVNVQDATFTNVVSDARRSLGRAVQLAGEGEWMPRTLTDALPLHESMTTDGEILDAAISKNNSQDVAGSLVNLNEALGLVRDLPFAGADYLWPDAEGITTRLTLSVMTAAVLASESYLQRGDTDGVFWATGQGLKVLPGHEGLLSLRMRAHALKGDLAAVRAELSSHQRAVARDVWSGGVTSPKLETLCRELMHSRDHVHSLSE